LVESVFGGDVFNQKSHLQLRRASLDNPRVGFGYIISVYSQNVGNIQMFNKIFYDESATVLVGYFLNTKTKMHMTQVFSFSQFLGELLKQLEKVQSEQLYLIR